MRACLPDAIESNTRVCVDDVALCTYTHDKMQAGEVSEQEVRDAAQKLGLDLEKDKKPW